jgi:C-terminal processing protease CtpA/Prc
VCVYLSVCVCIRILAHHAFPVTLQVIAGSTAEREGVLSGDLITAVEGNWVDSYALFLEVRGGEETGGERRV